jgi:hypothetical protein
MTVNVIGLYRTYSRNYSFKSTELEEALAAERQEYEDLTAKYEILEEEHVVTKAQLVMDKESVQA